MKLYKAHCKLDNLTEYYLDFYMIAENITKALNLLNIQIGTNYEVLNIESLGDKVFIEVEK